MTASDRERMFRLIPEARAFEWVEDLTPVGWLANVGSLGQAIAYAELFWPSFVEHDGCILLSGRFDQDNLKSWLAATGGDRQAVEGVINHTHILDLFVRHDSEPTPEQIIWLGRLLKEMRQAKVDRDFLGRRVVVSFPEDAGEDLFGYEITVFQARTV
jgi:hypothetical protein